ncbi:hypothetical protein [Pseudomonas panipatensis]|jgi:hypothetical protein|uniref:hypothetical protein n=1 Tax=Pseudomonas panipatensis TaxID=428992 RepID=UPI00147CAF51|nr:hypothetical protein [Pseudomonas panipatensis]
MAGILSIGELRKMIGLLGQSCPLALAMGPFGNFNRAPVAGDARKLPWDGGISWRITA